MIPSTKAETLAFLRDRLKSAQVPEFVYFQIVDWVSAAVPNQQVGKIGDALEGPLAIRSSVQSEDSRGASFAGHYRTRLNVKNEMKALSEAIDRVIESFDGNDKDQVIVQEMVCSVAVAGVVLTRDLRTGGNYYCVNYDDESSRTDLVTAGDGHPKTILLHHQLSLDVLEPRWLRDVIQMTQELEGLFGGRPLDIEFARTHTGQLFLLQVRLLVSKESWISTDRLSSSRVLKKLSKLIEELNHPRRGLAGRRTVLGLMPDWNPAELIGIEPSPLALSLFQWLITDSIWQQARTSMGYRPVSCPLVTVLAEKPYVDVRASFNSFLPAGLAIEIETPLIDAWLGGVPPRDCLGRMFHTYGLVISGHFTRQVRLPGKKVYLFI